MHGEEIRLVTFFLLSPETKIANWLFLVIFWFNMTCKIMGAHERNSITVVWKLLILIYNFKKFGVLQNDLCKPACWLLKHLVRRHLDQFSLPPKTWPDFVKMIQTCYWRQFLLQKLCDAHFAIIFCDKLSQFFIFISNYLFINLFLIYFAYQILCMNKNILIWHGSSKHFLSKSYIPAHVKNLYSYASDLKWNKLWQFEKRYILLINS